MKTFEEFLKDGTEPDPAADGPEVRIIRRERAIERIEKLNEIAHRLQRGIDYANPVD